MHVVASDEARDLIAARGGRLYVSIKASHCCGGARTLRTATEAEAADTYRAAGDDPAFELFVPRALERLPQELHVAVSRRGRRIEAFWDGCAWVV